MTKTRATGKGGHDLRIINSSHNVDYPATQAGLQAAIDALPAEGGWVRGPGLHTQIIISTPIVVPSHVKLMKVNLYLADGSDCNMIENSDLVAGNTEITIENCILDGNKAEQTSGDGMHFKGLTDGKIVGNTIVDCKDNGIQFVDVVACNDCLIEANRIYSCDNDGMHILSYYRHRIMHNYVEACGRYGILIFSCIYQTVHGNIVRGCDRGFSLDGVNESNFVGNHIKDCLYGFWMDSCVLDTVTGNSMDGIGTNAFLLDADSHRNTITANTLQGGYPENTNDCFSILGNDNIINGNVIHYAIVNWSFRHGIYVSGANNILKGNIITGQGTDGIHMEGAVANVITENRITGCGAYGIQLDAISNYNSIENNYTSGNTTACARVNNANCLNNVFTNNQFEEGDISNVGTNTRAWLNYDPSANAFITTINPPQIVDNVGAPVVDRFLP